MKRFVALVGLLLIGLIQVVSASADGPSAGWRERDRIGTDSTWLQSPAALAFGGGRFVAVGDREAAYSSDGVNWQVVSTEAQLKAVTYGDGQFVGVGRHGQILTSQRGEVWEAQESGLTETLMSVVFGDGLYLAGSQSGVLLTSPDGLRWEVAFHPEQRLYLHSVAYGHGRFVVGGAGFVILSTDGGNSWTTARTPGSQPFSDIVFGGGRFVAIASWFSNEIYTSEDGVKWTKQPVPTNAGELSRLAYGGGRYVAVGSHGTLFTSDDAQRWISESSGSSTYWSAVAYGRGAFVAIAYRSSLTSCGLVFLDVRSEHAACTVVEQLHGNGVIAGYSDGTYRPENRVTRAEFAKMLVLTLGLQPQPDLQLPFSDTADHWASTGGYLQAAWQIKAIQGYPGNVFRPDAPVTRAEMVKIAAATQGATPVFSPTYADVRANDWFAPWVSGARSSGLIGPLAPHPLWTATLFAGNTYATRGEAALLLSNVVGRQMKP